MKITTDSVRVQLSYPISLVNQPIVYRLVTDFGLIPSILRANFDVRTGGTLFLELAGDRGRLEGALAWLEEMGVGVDAIGLDGAQEWAI